MNQTLLLFPQGGAYRLENISAPRKGSGLLPISFLFSKIDGFCRLVIGVNIRFIKHVKREPSMRAMMDTASSTYSMNWISTPINNRQNSSIFQNKKGTGSRPDPFRGGAYNLQSISATLREKGLVHETNCACRLALSSIKRE